MLIDFDDTAATQNVAEMLLKRFGDPTWQAVRQRFRAGELALKEYQEIAFRNIRADPATMAAYVQEHATLRPYFKELWDHCQTKKIPMAIVSHGLDFYIGALLEKEALSQVPVYAVQTRFTPLGITYLYLYANPGQEEQGNSKGWVVGQYRRQGYNVVYAGDGRSDLEGAAQADLVFAHRILAEECRRQGIPFRPFHDFQDVLLALQHYPWNGLGASSGYTLRPTSPPRPAGSQEAPP